MDGSEDVEKAIEAVNKDFGCVIVIVVIVLAITAYQIAVLFAPAK